MTSGIAISPNIDSELRKFIESIPSSVVISQQLEHNANEAVLLKKMLRLAKDKERTEESVR